MNRKNQPSVKRFIVCFLPLFSLCCVLCVSIRLKRILLKIFPKNFELSSTATSSTRRALASERKVYVIEHLQQHQIVDR